MSAPEPGNSEEEPQMVHAAAEDLHAFSKVLAIGDQPATPVALPKADNGDAGMGALMLQDPVERAETTISAKDMAALAAASDDVKPREDDGTAGVSTS